MTANDDRFTEVAVELNDELDGDEIIFLDEGVEIRVGEHVVVVGAPRRRHEGKA